MPRIPIARRIRPEQSRPRLCAQRAFSPLKKLNGFQTRWAHRQNVYVPLLSCALNVSVDLFFENLERHRAIPQDYIVKFALIEFRSKLRLRALP